MKQAMTLFLIVAVMLCCILSSCGALPEALPESDTMSVTEFDTDSVSVEGNVDGMIVENSVVQIEADDGVYFLNFVNGNEADDAGNVNASVMGNLFFPSLRDMRNVFLSGNIPETMVEILKSTLTLSEKGYEFFDVRSLYDVVLPDATWTVTDVSLFGNMYYVPFENGSKTVAGHVCFLTPKTYDLKYEADVLHYKEEGVLLTDVVEYQGVPCVAYEYKTRSSTLRMILIQFETDNGTLEVLLKYRMAHDKKPELVNAEVPYQIYIYGNDERQNYIISLDMDNAPTPELLQSFAIVPFEP